MNIYVETNFVLELVFEQEQSPSCEQILLLCEKQRNRLIVPAYSFVEPYEKLVRQEAQRKGLASQLDRELFFSKSPQDAVVYASIIAHLRQENLSASVFLNRNDKDFSNPDVKQELERYNCKLMFNFDQGLNFIQSQLLR